MKRILFLLGFVVLTIFLTGSIGLNPEYVRQLTVAAEAVPAVQSASVAAPTHYYAMQAGDEYGYEVQVSEFQRQAGQVAAPLVMIRFAGEKNGKYQIFLTNGNSMAVIDCEKPCEFVRMRTYVNGEETAVEQMRRVQGSLVYYTMEDAMHGQLAQHFVVKKGVRVPLWYAD